MFLNSNKLGYSGVTHGEMLSRLVHFLSLLSHTHGPTHAQIHALMHTHTACICENQIRHCFSLLWNLAAKITYEENWVIYIRDVKCLCVHKHPSYLQKLLQHSAAIYKKLNKHLKKPNKTRPSQGHFHTQITGSSYLVWTLLWFPLSLLQLHMQEHANRPGVWTKADGPRPDRDGRERGGPLVFFKTPPLEKLMRLRCVSTRVWH